MKLRRCEDGKMRRGDGEKRGWGEEGKRGRWEDERVDYFCHRVFNKYFILHFTFSILHLGNFSGWEKEKIMNHEQHEQERELEDEKMRRCEDGKMRGCKTIATDYTDQDG
jgi:hypothetical protein